MNKILSLKAIYASKRDGVLKPKNPLLGKDGV